jgi:hypothetical protein
VFEYPAALRLADVSVLTTPAVTVGNGETETGYFLKRLRFVLRKDT